MDVLSNTNEKPRHPDPRYNDLVPQHLVRVDASHFELRGRCAGVRKGLTTAPTYAQTPRSRVMQSLNTPERLQNSNSPER